MYDFWRVQYKVKFVFGVFINTDHMTDRSHLKIFKSNDPVHDVFKSPDKLRMYGLSTFVVDW